MFTKEASMQIVLASLILMRMSGFILLNPVLGRKNIPAMAKAGMIMVLTIMIFPLSSGSFLAPGSSIEFAVLLIKEFALGYLLGYVMQLFEFIVTAAGSVIDFQIGLSMATVYDPQNGAQTALTGSILQIYYMLLFFAVDGHLALMKILVKSSDIVPYGQVRIGPDITDAVLVIFTECLVVAVRLAFPLIAIQLITEIGVGILMKIIPQINLFVVNIQVKIIVGIAIMAILISPIGGYLGGIITDMLNEMQDILKLTAGA